MGHEHNVVTIFSAPNYCYQVVSRWTLDLVPIIELFVSYLCMFSPCMKMYFSLPGFCS
jgi:hypothetical protein